MTRRSYSVLGIVVLLAGLVAAAFVIGPPPGSAITPTVTSTYYTESGSIYVPAPGVIGAENAALTVRVIKSADHGDVWLSGDGGFGYEAEPGFTGKDSFLAEISEGTSSTVAEVVVESGAVADKPVADDEYSAVGTQTAIIAEAPGVLGNDSGFGDSDALTAELVTPPSHGKIELASDGSFSYFPDTKFTGVDSFGYRALGASGKSDNGEAWLLVGLDGRVLYGRVTAPDGSVLSGVDVGAVVAGSDEPAGSGETDAEGRYAVASLAADESYGVVARPTAYNLGHETDYTVGRIRSASRKTEAGNLRQAVQLGLGARVDGHVTDENGNPLEGVEVKSVLKSGTTDVIAVTDADGAYVARGVAPGGVRIVFDPSARNRDASVAYALQWYVDVQEPERALELPLGPGDQASVPVELLADPDAVTATGSIAGTINNAGAPVADVVVSAVTQNAETEEWGSFGTARSAADGTYRIDGLPEGSYVVRFESTPSGGVKAILMYYDGTLSPTEATAVNVVAGEVSGNINVDLASP